VLCLSAAVLWVHYYWPQADMEPGYPIQLKIPSGSSTRDIAALLAEAGVVKNANRFSLRTRLSHADDKLQPGVYDLSTGMSDDEVMEQLTAGPVVEYQTVTIPEGFRIEQIADRVCGQTGISRKKFLALARRGASKFADGHPYLADAYRGSLEGYLFPKTYRIRKGMTAKQVIEMMLDQFDRETADLDYARAGRLGLSPREVVVMASMIERECKLDDERSLVSAVIYNRLGAGRRLKIDATIEYVLPGNRFRLTNRDLYTKSPYNTYLHAGLPPGPISNPGLKSLEAAAAPADSAFTYYVLTGKDGSHTFATNLADFLAAKRKSKEVFGR
jgi:UPF0755 protein